MMHVSELTAFPGIGEKIALKLIEHFGSEQGAMEALRQRDVASLAEVPGISEKYAISLVHQAIAHDEGCAIEDFLQTPEAMSVYDRIIGLIRSYAHTQYSRARLSTYIPYPSSKIAHIKATQASLEEYMGFAEKLSGHTGLEQALKKLRYLKKPSGVQKSRDRVVLADNRKDYEAILKGGIDKYLDVNLVENVHDLVDMAKGYAQALVVGQKYAGGDYPEELSLEFVDNPGDLWWLVPEVTIGFFATNKEPLEAALETIRIVRAESPGFCKYMDEAKTAELSSELARIGPDGELAVGVDAELDRLKGILARFNVTMQAVLKQANHDLQERMEKSTVTLKGSQLLGMFGTGQDAALKNVLEKEVSKAYAEVVASAKDSLREQLALKPFEMQHVDVMFDDEIVYPIEINHRAVEGFRNAVNRALTGRVLENKRASAKKLAKYEPACRDMIREALEFDMYFAIGLFAADYGLRMPKLTKAGVNISAGRNIFLQKKAEPVSYSVGVKNGQAKGERIILLSGVNSGGKTTMLDMLAQIAILAHMGFPVPAEAVDIGPIDALLYYSKSKGTLTAGAFETTIRDFSRVVSPGAKLVLVDELESITEPGASARIIAGILEALYENPGSEAVFVSHLAEQIMANTKCPIRVDGIEAKGLDANLNLIVDRTPRYNYLAKSTPELIVERLTRSSSGGQKEFYGRLLAKFKSK
ncbi:MAG: DNA-binding protein MutS2 [Methanocella sp. PtaU1.Bin125]|nr:MAG: DNA-binding protein MutS2 [Methanocella sp. PtaU1.Bin125]